MNQWDKIATHYDHLMSSDGDTIRKYLYDPAVFLLLDDLTNKTVLDAGCGNGYWTRKMAKMHARAVYGIDSSRYLLKYAENSTQSTNINLSIGNLSEKLHFPNNYFDFIISNLVLDYLPSIDLLAKEFYRTLKQNGSLVFGIQHPFYHVGYSIKQEASLVPNRYEEKISYFERIKINKLTFEAATLTIYNRTLGDYINTFIDQGFTIKKVVEPEYSDEMIEHHKEYLTKRNIPRFILFKFIKNSS